MLQRYVCHKEVLAAKIVRVHVQAPPVFQGPTCRGSVLLGTACGHCERCAYERDRIAGLTAGALLELEGSSVVPVSNAYMQKHAPTAGGYYVRYADGYESFSPTQAFEAGYTLMRLETAPA